MAISKTVLPGRLGANFSTVTAVGGTAVAVATSSSTIYAVEIDNTANSVNSFLKFYNLAAASVTVGTDDPYMILKAPASKKVTYHFDQGVALGTAISIACLNSAGTAGTAAPSSSVTAKIVYD